MKTYKLLDRVTDVPINISAYKNKEKFNPTLLKVIDTSVVYEEFDAAKKMRVSLDYCTSCRGYSIYKFYSNGCFNVFFFNRNSALPVNEFNPFYSGYRGVYYTNENKIQFDLFAEIDQRQHTGKITGTLSFRGDTLFVKQNDIRGLNATTYPIEVYVKKKLPIEYFIYKANW